MVEDRDRWKVFVKAVMNLLEYGYFNDYMGTGWLFKKDSAPRS